MAESIKKVSTQSKTVVYNPDLHESQAKVIQSMIGELEDQFKSLVSLTKKRQVVLEDSLSFYQLIQVWKNSFHYSIKITFLCFFQVFEDSGMIRSLPSFRNEAEKNVFCSNLLDFLVPGHPPGAPGDSLLQLSAPLLANQSAKSRIIEPTSSTNPQPRIEDWLNPCST